MLFSDNSFSFYKDAHLAIYIFAIAFQFRLLHSILRKAKEKVARNGKTAKNKQTCCNTLRLPNVPIAAPRPAPDLQDMVFTCVTRVRARNSPKTPNIIRQHRQNSR